MRINVMSPLFLCVGIIGSSKEPFALTIEILLRVLANLRS
jgi:hypothetical protein